MSARTGPLAGLRVLEIASQAPAPFTAMMLSDLGAEVLRLDRPPGPGDRAEAPGNPLVRGRRSVAVDCKHPDAAELVLSLAANADVVLEGFRPGVCERLGFGPDVCLERNPRLVYGRMTGWGQTGPMAQMAGHDINYLAVSGGLEPIGPAGAPPVPPINYVADFGGGGMLLAVGVLAALLERERSGRGQVVDAAMTEGSALLSVLVHAMLSAGIWGPRGTNIVDGSSPFYGCYECADGQFVAVGAIEPQFYALLVDGLGIDLATLPDQNDRGSWPAVRAQFAQRFRTQDRDVWAKQFGGTDACVTPVLSPIEAAADAHMVQRGAFVEVGGMTQPGPAPRFSRSTVGVRSVAPWPGQHSHAALADWGIDRQLVADLTSAGVVTDWPGPT